MAVWHTRLRRDRLIWGPNSLAEFARLNYFKSMGLNEKTKFAWADWDFIDNPPTFQEQ